MSHEHRWGADDQEADDREDAVTIAQTYLSFRVAASEYAVPVVSVREIVRLEQTFSLPDVPPYVRGVINLRGRVIPLVDVRARFGLSPADVGERTVVVVLDVADAATGLVVDDVSEVLELPPETREAMRGGQSHSRPMVSEVARSGERLHFLLDLPKFLDV